MAENTPESAADVIALAGDITIAWLQNPNVHPGAQDVPDFLKSMHAAIAGLGIAAPASTDAGPHEPAVPVRSSVKPDYLVSLIDGKKYQTLKRHLAGHGLTPEAYRERYGLKFDYPMVAANFAAKRRDIATRIGLGRKAAPAAGAPSEGVIGAPVEEVKDASVTPNKTRTPTTASAKPKRAARQPASTASSPEVAAKPVADTPVDTPVDTAKVEGSALPKPKAKRAGAAKKAATKPKTDAKAADKAKADDAPARKPRAKKSLAQAIELALPEG